MKFDGEKIIDRFETFINPGIPIPKIITHITSIKDEDVANAPTMESVRDKLELFVGEAPIVGHNIDFDVNFLKAKGVNIPGPLYDTLQLSMILLPGLASYSLDTLGRTLKISHENKHRAMADTMACHKLFCILKEKIQGIDIRTLKKIQEVIQRSQWHLGAIFTEENNQAEELNTSKTSQLPEREANAPLYQKTMDEVLDAFSPTGKLSKIIGNYESRPNQQHMAELIINALEKNKKLVIEAGTGMGKTLAYMSSAVHSSLSHNKKIVISTYTHTLQEQLLKKDVPLLEKLFNADNKVNDLPAFKTALLKGRKNYLSYKRFELLSSKLYFADHEVTFIVKILLWLSRSQSGELDELTFVGKEYQLLDEVCCAEFACPHDDPEFKNGCYLMKARQKASEADIIIVNHALLLQDCTSDTPILPEYTDLIVDEAHHLEKVATDTFTIVLAFHSFIRPFEKLKKNLDASIKFITAASEINEIQLLQKSTDQLLSRIEIFFGFVGIFLEKNLKPDSFYQINLSETDLSSKDWIQAKEAGKIVAENGKLLLEKLTRWNDTLKENKESIWKEVKGSIYTCEKKISDLKKVIESDEKSLDQMTWISKTYEQNITICRSPVDVGPLLQNVLWNVKSSIILTSATLRTDQTFNFIRKQLGLNQNFEEAALPSHFSYPDQVKILIPEGLPEPATEGYFLTCANIIKEIIKANGGRTLVLFTAKKALSATFHHVAPELKKAGFNVLAQQITGGRGKILEHFKDEPETSAIFGTQSFWEGVDIQGDDLNCVIILKLPFDPPDDPMIVARSKKYRDSFGEYQLPRAILKFKQGFGRLIRTSKDTGTIVILDTRIIQKTYGHQFLEALPKGIKIAYTPKEQMNEFFQK